MTTGTNPTRRAVLAAGAGTAGAAFLAACSSGSSGTPPASTGAASSAPAAAPGTTVAALTDVTVGSSISVTLPDGPGLVTRTGASTVVCFSAICPHQGCTVKPDGARFMCPCHQSQFDPKTGDVTGGPAPSPLEKVAVTVVGGRIVTD